MKLTDTQQEVLDLYLEHGNKSKVAEIIGCNESNIRQCLQRIEKKGKAPWLSPAVTPDHLKLSKTTVQYNKEGEVVQEWKRLAPQAQAMSDFVDSLCQRVKGKIKLPKCKVTKFDKEILSEICIYDAHIGMYAEEGETLSEDYNTDLAVQRMFDTTSSLLARMGNPEELILTFGGDMLHSDTRNNQTEQSKHILDVDSRYDLVAEKAAAACVDVVAMAAQVANKVRVVVLKGNHSWNSETWLRVVLEYAYMGNENVSIMNQRSERQHFVYGSNLLVWAHGDKVPMNRWQGIVSTELAHLWGITRNRHLKMGHLHHKRAKNAKSIVTTDNQGGWVENHGLLVEYLPALTATDAWHASKGFIGSQKAITGFQYHYIHGLISRLYQPV